MESVINIEFGSGKKYFSIVVSNSVLKQEKVKKSKKSRNHGFGIGKIKSVLEKYNGKLDLEVKQNMVRIAIYLPI